MRRSCCLLIACLILVLVPRFLFAAVSEETGEEVNLAAFADLPVLSRTLAEACAKKAPMELVRVIILLEYQPQDLVSRDVQAKYAEEMEEIRRRIGSINGVYAKKRNLEAAADSANYHHRDLQLSAEDRNALRRAGEDHESLSLVIRNEIAGQLAAEVDHSQAALRKTVEQLGGTVEFGTTCVNALVALIPAGSLESLAEADGPARIFGDQRMQGDLANAAHATRVSDPFGLWDLSFTGGNYDPAVLDTGADLSHPGLTDTAGRNNFYSWYLVAGHADPRWDDVVSEDDVHGHGTFVTGIIASYGTDLFPDELGMAHGVGKIVTLKASWHGTDFSSHMYPSDAMRLMDRALYDTNSLRPTGTFNDDVDGLNLSSGKEITDGEDDFCRFFDSVISSYPDLTITFSGGNSGPDNTFYRSPASTYNGITVATVDDMDTPERSDDTLWHHSTRGPTNNSRRKPDLCAPGAYIRSCHPEWETFDDYTSTSGSSLAAPMVQGIAMDLMDAGVTDELAIKALLINTAQKNEPMIDFDDDDDGWSEAYGWGYVNALAAYYHRSDIAAGSVTPRGSADDYRLYRGQMKDEGTLGEGRDRATLVWNRHATYNPDNYPTSYYSLSDLNLRLYDESDGSLIDTDLNGLDNVHQVRVDSGAPVTETVIKVYAWSTSFDHGGATEEFALATEENFVEVELPQTLDFTMHHYGTIPSSVEPNEQFELGLFARNHADVAAHQCIFELELPTGWTLLSASQVNVGSTAGNGGDSAEAFFTVVAPAAPAAGEELLFHFSHTSYGEASATLIIGDYIDVEYDTTPPTPDPLTWASEPMALGIDAISMQSDYAYDDHHAPVQYLFDYVGSPTGGSGGANREWLPLSPSYTNTGLQPNHRYGYRAAAADSSQVPSMGGFTPIVYVYTHAATPGVPSITGPTSSTLDVTIDANGNPDFTECAIYLSGNGGATQYFLATDGSPAGGAIWQPIADWGTVTVTGLDPETTYAFRVEARNGDGIVTPWSDWGYGDTTADVQTISAGFTCQPDSGTVPFQSMMTVEMTNEYSGQSRRMAGRINVQLANGTSFSNWRGGYTNLDPGETYSAGWAQTFPALGSIIGTNTFSLQTEDITPAPYNQPPYPAAGDTDFATCMVTAAAP